MSHCCSTMATWSIFTVVLGFLLAFSEGASFSCSNSCDSHFSSDCRCDEDCSIYRDCCKDSPFIRQRVPIRKDIFCSSTAEGDAYMVNFCSRTWTGPLLIERKCVLPVYSWRDPIINAPVTSSNSTVTYKNAYCAICNDDTYDIKVWDSVTHCKLSNNMTQRNLSIGDLSYSSAERRWGYYTWNKTIAMDDFYPCNILFKPSSSLKDVVRPCDTNEISTCPSDWKNKKTRKRCSRYRDPVYGVKDAIKYKNIHCAKCNGVSRRKVTCEESRFTPAKTLPNFAIIFGPSFVDGRSQAFSRQGRCARNEVYDAFSKRCRQVICEIPGLFVNGCT